MAGSYILPQARVFQEFSRTPSDVTQNLNPFIIGPSFQLMRYAKEDERADCSFAKYSGTSNLLPWATGALGTVVDKSWYGVTFVDAYVKLGGPMTPTMCLDDADGKGTQLEFMLAADTTLAGTSDSSKLAFGVAVKAGDYLAYEDDGETKYTKIRAISIGTPTAGSDEVVPALRKRGAAGSVLGTAFTVDVSGYKGQKPATVNIVVTGNGTKATWSSNVAGISSSAEWTVSATAQDLGLGLKIAKGSGSLADGTYVLTLSIVEPYVRDTVTVSDIVPVNKQFTFVRRFDTIAARDEDLAPGTDGVTIAPNACVDIGADEDYAVFAATAYLDQRNLRTDHTDRVYSVRSDTDIALELGAYDTPDNPLAYAAHIMLLNNANTAIKFIGLESDDAEGYATALDRASLTTEVYAFCPLTEDRAIIDAVVADCNRRSTPEQKSWRIAFFSMPTSETTDVTPETADGTPAKCTVSATGLLTFSDGDSRFTETVRAGDVVAVFVNGEAVERVVTAVKSNTTLQLADKVGTAGTQYRFTVTHTRPRGEYVEAIAETSASFRDRRAYNVFPNTLRASDGNLVSGMYGAAAVCALTCSVAPQQPITNVEIKGFTDLPDVYSKFSRDELNEIAAGGTLILMQDRPGGTVYVRHQISTAYRDGNLNTTELSLTKNLDSVSYYFADRTSPYIGKYNITDDLLTEVRGVIEDGLTHLETTTETNKLIGPQVIAEGTEIRSLYRTAEKDKAYCDVALNLPAPFNNFDLHLQVI